MTTSLRFLVRVDAGWNVAIECPSRPAFSLPKRAMKRVVEGAGARARSYPERTDGDAKALSAKEVAERQRRTTNREPKNDDVKELGEHLFEVLVGSDAWRLIQAETEAAGAKFIELALGFPAGDADLTRLHWELLRAPSGFLLGSATRRVAITRIVAGTATPRSIPASPRILLVVGGKLDDGEIRPAAECIAMLQETSTGGRTAHTEVLLEASQRSLRTTLEQLKPHVVHFVCHGSIDGDKTVLELEDENGAPGRLSAEQLIELFALAKVEPALVVLSACYTASSAGPGFVSGEATAPFAAELVQRGVPVVIGMAGRVADSACRLFARRFGEALICNEPIILATQEGRSAAFVGNADPTKSIDWAFPVVFLAESVPPDFGVETDASGTSERLLALERALGIGNLRPVFCGRFDELSAFRSMFAPRGKPVLAVYSDDAGPREAGKTWLLKELVARALRAGHLPCTIFPGVDAPRTLLDVAKRVADALQQTQKQLKLAPDSQAQIPLLFKPAKDALLVPHLNPWIKQQLEMDPVVRAPAIKLAVESDLKRVLADARKAHPTRFGQASKIVLFLDEAHRVAELGALLEDFLGEGGLDTDEDEVRAVISFRFEAPAKEVLKPIVETRTGAWFVRRLKNFRSDGEDMVSYQRLLMNPFRDDLKKVSATQRWTFNFETVNAKEFEAVFRDNLGDKAPGVLTTDPTLYMLAEMGRPAGFVVQADDEAILELLRKRWPG